MRWSEYYQKANEWELSTVIKNISSLENMGKTDEIIDVLYIIDSEDTEAAVRLLNRALESGVKFSGENLVEISNLFSEDIFKKSLYQSADALSAKDLEDMYGCIDDALIIDVIKRYKLSAPREIADEHEEELCMDVRAPISWNRFYHAFSEWKEEFAKVRLQAVTEFETVDEVLNVAQELFVNDERGACQFIIRAIHAGVQFKNKDLIEIAEWHDENTIKQILLQPKLRLSDESLEELSEYVDDDFILQIAKKRKLKLPKSLREEETEEEENTDIKFAIQSAISAADYALECLVQALSSLNDCGNISYIDMITKNSWASYWKYTALSEADVEIEQAQIAMEDLNRELRALRKNKNVQLKYGRLASAVDLWIDDSALDMMTHLRINKAQKRIQRGIRDVENLRRKLVRML